ncbi:MAG: STAS domain-containing protein [Ignavibacteriales bacterium]|nr:STAS domain-containing protein [Ignavibacteriales bacterium]
MKFEITKDGKATILKLHGRKLDSTVAPELKAEFLILCKPKNSTKLIIDLKEVQFCDSSGLSALLIADRTMRQHGGTVHLVHVHDKVLDLMRITQLDRMFTINKKVDDALKA